MPRRTMTAVCTLLLLGACSPSHNEAPPPKLFKEQRDVLDQTKTVESYSKNKRKINEWQPNDKPNKSAPHSTLLRLRTAIPPYQKGTIHIRCVCVNSQSRD